MILLIDHGANVNHVAKSHHLNVEGEWIDGHPNVEGDLIDEKTPIFKGRTYDTVKLLMENEAKPNHRFLHKEEISHKTLEVSAIEHVMKYNPDSAKAILDTCIEMQEDGDLILDLSIFDQEQKKNRDDLDDDEMSLLSAAAEHSSMSTIGDPQRYPIILHPLIQLFLSMKFKSIRFMFLSKLLFHVILVILLTTIGIRYVELTSCEMKGNKENCFKNVKYGIEGCQIMDMKNETIWQECPESIIHLIDETYKKETEFSNITSQKYPKGKQFSMKCHKNSFRYIFL